MKENPDDETENQKVTRKIKEWIDSNRKDKTRIVFEMQDQDDPNVSYSLTLGNLFDHAVSLGKAQQKKDESEWLRDLSSRLERANDKVPESNYNFWDYMKRIRTKIQMKLKQLESKNGN